MPECSNRIYGKYYKIVREKQDKIAPLYSTPYTNLNCNYSRHNSIAAYAKEHDLEYLDMNLKLEEVGTDWATDSLDKGDHLNLSGAKKVSQYLGEYLSTRYDLPDRRNEKNICGMAEGRKRLFRKIRSAFERDEYK